MRRIKIKNSKTSGSFTTIASVLIKDSEITTIPVNWCSFFEKCSAESIVAIIFSMLVQFKDHYNRQVSMSLHYVLLRVCSFSFFYPHLINIA